MEVMAQAVDLNYEECLGFGQSFIIDAEEEIHLSLVAVDASGKRLLQAAAGKIL